MPANNQPVIKTQSTTHYDCLNCGAPIDFKPEKQKFSCAYCLSEFSLAEIEEHYALHETLQAERAEVKRQQARAQADSQALVNEYICDNCGAHVVTTDTTTATFCFYCHSPIILHTRLLGDLKPNQMITFQISEDAVLNKFKQWLAGKKYLPDDFGSDAHISKLSSMYLPYWYQDATVDVDYLANSEAKRTWRSGDFLHTETTYKEHVRSGLYDLDNLNTSAYSKIDQNYLNGIEPFHPEQIREFSLPLLQGYLAEAPTSTEGEAQAYFEREINTVSQTVLRRSLQGLNITQVRRSKFQVHNEVLRSVLLPVWVLTYPYGDKTYVFAVNGQTGKAHGELPIDEEKLNKDAKRQGLSAALILALLALFVLFILL